MRICVTWLGRPSASPYEIQVETYRKRVSRRWPADDRPLRPTSGGRRQDPDRAVRLEAEALARHCEPAFRVVALHEGGTARDSEHFAKWLAGFEDRGTPGLVFAIGSDIGLDRSFLDRADERVSLSSMTLPHLLARLVLWEQLFRATQILGGGAYHRDGLQ